MGSAPADTVVNGRQSACLRAQQVTRIRADELDMAWVLDGAHVVLFDLLGWALQKTNNARKNMELGPLPTRPKYAIFFFTTISMRNSPNTLPMD